MNIIMKRVTSLVGLLALAGLTGCWERPPTESVQTGYRGTAMVELNNPRLMAAQQAANVAPAPAPAAEAGGPPASAVFKNVQVLGNLSVAEFTRTMTSLTSWVSPTEGCAYCHKPGEGLEADTLYTKVVARKMLQMTQAINVENKAHVGSTGVTCYTCHRGQHVPANTWVNAAASTKTARFLGVESGQNRPATAVGITSLPYDPFKNYLSGSADIKVASNTALPAGNKKDVPNAERTFGLMVHMSDSLGVNCTYCHNSQAFDKWSVSTPQRVTAWHGIRMARDINNSYLDPLSSVFPANRKGPSGDVAKVNCQTCHQGATKPLLGAQMAKNYPAMYSPAPPAPLPVVAQASPGKK